MRRPVKRASYVRVTFGSRATRALSVRRGRCDICRKRRPVTHFKTFLEYPESLVEKVCAFCWCDTETFGMIDEANRRRLRMRVIVEPKRGDL